MEGELCVVCLETLNDDKTVTAMPGCGHRLHTVCMLNCAQYSIRCPTCRATPAEVTPRVLETTTLTLLWNEGSFSTEFNPQINPQINEEEDVYASARREWRRYCVRRRRLLSQRPKLSQRVTMLKTLRQTIDAEYKLTQRIYDQRCRQVWSSDTSVLAHRAQIRRLRRRELRLERQVDAELESVIGPEPDLDD